jgi:short-subunit dehydrogenase
MELFAHPYLLAVGGVLVVMVLMRLMKPRGNAKRKFGGKVVVITGASSGLGEELSIQLSKFAPKLVLAARRIDRLEELKKRCLTAGAAEVLLVQTDVSKQEDCKRLIDDTLAKLKTIDVLFLNAGVAMSTTLFKASTPDVLENVMKINYHGAVNTAFYALPMLRKSNGHIVVTSSVMSTFITRGTSAYAASKAALNAFFDSLRLEEKRNKVNVTIICPGHVETEIQKKSLGADGKPLNSDDTKKLGFEVSLNDAVRQMIDATASNEWRRVYTLGGKFFVRLRAAFPQWFDEWITANMF